MDQALAELIEMMERNGVLYLLGEKQLTELMGPPVWRSYQKVGWNLHPYIWEGTVYLHLATGEVQYSHDHGAAT